MATIIDSLLVKLGLDSSEFNAGKNKVDKGLKDTGAEADKTGAKLKKTGKDGAEGFENVAKSATKFLAIIGGTMAVKRFIEQTVESSAALDRLSQNLSANVSTVSAWSKAAELAGGSADGLQGTMDMLSKSQTELQLTGQSGLIPYFSALRVSLADTEGKARGASDILLDLSDRFSGMDRTTANNMGRMMGLDQGTMQLLLKGRSEVELMIKRQKEFGAVTKQQAEEASRLKLAMTDSRQSFEAFGRELLSAATPAIEKFFSVMADFGTWMHQNKEFVQTFLTIIAVGLGAVAAATIPINLTVVAVLALAAAIAALWQDYQTFKRGGDSLIDWAKWEPGIKGATTGLKFLKDLLVDMLVRAVAVADAIFSLAKGDFSGAKAAAKVALFGIPGVGLQPGESPAATAPATKAGGRVGGASTQDSQGRLTALEQKYGLPPGLLDRVWNTESGRGRNMTSPAGAQGHFQFMPATAAQYGLKNPNDFNESSDAAARMYRDLLKANGGDVKLAAAAYNWGQGNLNRKGMGAAPTETIDYIRKVTGGLPGASQAAAGAGAGQVAQGNLAGAPGAGNRSVETHIGEVKVYTAATDAAGIAKDMGGELDYLFTAQANYGLN